MQIPPKLFPKGTAGAHTKRADKQSAVSCRCSAARAGGAVFGYFLPRQKVTYVAESGAHFFRQAEQMWRWGDLHPRPSVIKSRCLQV